MIERVYDLVVLSDSLGEPAVASILATVARGPRPPAVLLLANGEMPATPSMPTGLLNGIPAGIAR